MEYTDGNCTLRGGGDSYIARMEMVVGNSEKNPQQMPGSCFEGMA